MTKLRVKEDEAENVVALLQRRGKINTDSLYGYKKQSFAGLCEITCYGKAEGKETPEQALKREMTEELGQEATDFISKCSPIKIYERTESDNDHVHIWAVYCGREILKKIKLDISTGGIELITKDQIVNLKYEIFSPINKESSNLGEIIVFETPRLVLEKTFEIFKQK